MASPAEYPDYIEIVIDDPDTGEAHVEVPGRKPLAVPKISPLRVQNPKDQLPQVASFDS